MTPWFLLALALFATSTMLVRGTRTVHAQPGSRGSPAYPVPADLDECRVDPSRFGDIEILRPSHRRHGGEEFYVARYLRALGYMRVAVDRRTARVSANEAMCAFIVASHFLYESLSEHCRDNIVEAYGGRYGYYDVFRTGFALADEDAPRYFLTVPSAQDSTGIGLPFDHEESGGNPNRGVRDLTCPTSVELNLRTGAASVVSAVPPFVRR